MRWLGSLFIACCASVTAGQGTAVVSVNEEDGHSAILGWLEQTVMRLARHEKFNLRLSTRSHTDRQRMWACGCAANASGHFHPEPIQFGNMIGTVCTRAAPEDKPQWDGESCGVHACTLFSKTAGDETVHFCPPGMAVDCVQGCAFRFEAGSAGAPQARVAALRTTVLDMLHHQHQVLELDPAFALRCGCAPAGVCDTTGLHRFYEFALTQGTGIGHGCWRSPGSEKPPWEESCGALCKEGGGSRRVHTVLCPRGLVGTCEEACRFDPSVAGLSERIELLRAAVSHLTASLQKHGAQVEPTRKQMLACGCKRSKAVPMRWTNTQVGYACTRDVPGYHDGCGPVCRHAGGADIGKEYISFCPPGFMPSPASCPDGCIEQLQVPRHGEL